ncbi:hypothetical protein NONI108955_29375 [Nocardia ninae]
MDETGIEQVWKVGELATKSGLTVRTLHHYDPSGWYARLGAPTSVIGSTPKPVSSACHQPGTTSTRSMFRRTPTSLRFSG